MASLLLTSSTVALRPGISAMAFSASAEDTPVAVTEAPSRRKARAIAAPIPEVPPVTSTW